MMMRRLILLAAAGLLALLPLGAIERAFGPGAGSGSLFAPAVADDDDDDDDDDDRPSRRARSFDDDDDDDDDEVRRPRRRAAAPRRAAPEIVATGVTAEQLGRIRAAGFSVLSERRLAVLPDATVRLAPPGALSGPRARARLAELAPSALIDVNALYRPNAGRVCSGGGCFPWRAEGWTVPVCAARGAVGMIDTRVETGHPALAGRTIESLSTRSEKRSGSSPAHGTEVAILLSGGRSEPDDMRLIAVDAFHRAGRTDQADVFDLVAAIDLLAARGAAVVNLSLAGPPNAVLDRAGAVAAERGMTLVAAVGNDGPNAKPRYPAAYPWAVAVTAVDASGAPYRRAGRGSHVAFAAPGVRIELPDKAMRPSDQRSGTSYAAPLVTAALSALRAEGGPRPASEAVASLARSVDDKGAPGRDPVFGWGALEPEKGCPATRRADAR